MDESINIFTKKRGRPRKEEKNSYETFLAKASQRATKQQYAKKLKEYSYIDISSPQDDFKKDFNYDYSNNQATDKEAFLFNNALNNLSDSNIEKINNTPYASQVVTTDKPSEDKLGLGVKDEQEYKDNPFDLGISRIIHQGDIDETSKKATSELDISTLSKLGDLKYILADALAGDKKALNNPTLKLLGLENVKTAIQWLLDNDGITTSMDDLLNNSWRLVYRAKPPTMEEFLTEKYIGGDAETLYPWVRDFLIKAYDPLKPYRTLIWYYFIGGGKSTASCLSNLYISLCNSLMWSQHKYYGHAQPLDALISTPRGNIPMGELKIGDVVNTPTGTSEIKDIQDWGLMDVYEVELEDGRTMECSKQHLFKVSYKKDKNNNPIWEVLSLEEIMGLEDECFIYDEVLNATCCK